MCHCVAGQFKPATHRRGTTMSLKGIRVLILENEVWITVEMKAVLEKAGCVVQTALTVPGALCFLISQQFDVAFIDLREANIGERREELPKLLRDTAIIFVVGEYKKALVEGYPDNVLTLTKPFGNEANITNAVVAALAR